MLPSKEERLKKLYAEVKRNNIKDVSISSRHLHSSVSSSKVIFSLEDQLPEPKNAEHRKKSVIQECEPPLSRGLQQVKSEAIFLGAFGASDKEVQDKQLAQK